MKKLNIILFFAIFSNCLLFAKEVPLELARQVAKNFYYERVNQTSKVTYSDIKFKDKIILENNINPAYYVFNLENRNGFVIIAAEDNVYPILGYSFEGSYGESDLPPALVEFVESYEQQIAFVKINNLQADPEIKSTWQKYSTNAVNLKNSLETIGPLLTTTWDQDRYYNAFCPEDPDGANGHARVGCVAIAMAQVMKYHNYPHRGSGSHSYYYSPYGTISANFGATTYNWKNMADFLTDYNNDVALLCFHCGVSVEMMYGPNGSGAYSEDVPEALIQYFNYASTTHIEHKYEFSNEGWKNLLKSELDAFRPMYYSGYGAGGHAFVCDGYQDWDHFHFNWGWGGLYNGYFYVSSLHPGTHDYSDWQAAVVGIQSPLPPVADFTSNLTTVLTGSSVSFTDLSTNIPASWHWSFEGGTPAHSTEKNPENIIYETPGTYSVTLTVTNQNGSGTVTKTDYITVSHSALPIADFTVDHSIPAIGTIVNFHDVSLNNPISWLWTFIPNTITFFNGTDANSRNPEIQFDEPIVYSVNLVVSNANGSDSVAKNDLIFSGGLPLPFEEDFELGSFKEKWTIENPDYGITWDGYYKLSGNLPSRKSAWIYFYDYPAIGERDRLISPLLNFSGLESAYLQFKHAYAIYDISRRDSLIIHISTDNGINWTRIFEASDDGTGNFATHPPTTAEFVPKNTTDWCGVGYGSDQIRIDLSPWAGNANVKIMFESYNGHGNSLYIDDFLVNSNQPPFLVSPIPDTSFAEDTGPHTIIKDLNKIFVDPDPDDILRFIPISHNYKIRPIAAGDSLVIFTGFNYFGSADIIVLVNDGIWDSVSDTFIVEILPINDAPQINLPDSISFPFDSSYFLNIWECASDIESPDSSLIYSFDSDNDSLLIDFNEKNGELVLSSPCKIDNCNLYAMVTDDSNAISQDTLIVRIKQPTGIEITNNTVPVKYELFQNHPNPFNAITTIRFSLPELGEVKIEVYNNLGQKVATLFNGRKSTGFHEIKFDASSLASGLYFYRIQAGQFIRVKKMLVMK